MANVSRAELGEFFVSCFNTILYAEEKTLAKLTGGELSGKEIHFIEAVYKAMAVGENCFSTLANFLHVTFGTLTTSFLRLQKKGYLYKEQDRDDKRIFYVMPTEKARAVHAEHTRFHESILDYIYGEFNKHEIADLAKFLGKIEEFFSAKLD